GSWVSLFESKDIKVNALKPYNSGLEMNMPLVHLAGEPLKNIRLFNDQGEKKGELVFTEYGLEGSAVYYMNRFVRQKEFPQELYVDLKPQLSFNQIKRVFSSSIEESSNSIGDNLKNK